MKVFFYLTEIDTYEIDLAIIPRVGDLVTFFGTEVATYTVTSVTFNLTSKTPQIDIRMHDETEYDNEAEKSYLSGVANIRDQESDQESNIK